MGKFQAILASYRILLPPTFAVLLLMTLIFTIPAQLRLQRWANEQKKIIQVGEVKYWGITPTARPPSAHREHRQ
jgi:hypothetical protein